MGQKARLVTGSSLAVIVAVGLSVAIIYAFPAATQVTTTAQGNAGMLAQCGFATACSADNPSGLVLTLSVNTTTTVSIASLTFEISEFNPTTHYINLSKSYNWPIDSLSWPCNGGSTPYGLAVFRGYYTLQNVSSAGDVLEFPPIACITVSNATTFSIPPLSTLPYPYLIWPIRVSGGSPGGSQPAVYTLAAGDEWGDLVLLHFSVST